MASKRVIKLLGEPVQNEDDAAAEAITPGHLVDFNVSGDLVKHASAGGAAALAIALEREEMGKDIDTAYAVGDTVKVGVFPPGTRFLGLVASGANLAKGEKVESAGNGMFRAHAAGVILGRSLEAITPLAVSRLRIEAM